MTDNHNHKKEHDLFRDMREQMTPDTAVLEQLDRKIELEQQNSNVESGPATAKQSPIVKKRHRAIPYIFAAAATIVVLAVGVTAVLPALSQPAKPITTVTTLGITTQSTSEQATSPASYGELFNSLQEHVKYDVIYDVAPMMSLQSDSGGQLDGQEVREMTENSTAATPDESAANKSEQQSQPLGTATTADTIGSQDFSQTNNQVVDVDEGDVVKTDGKYIYILHKNEVIIALADGTGSKEITRFSLLKDTNNPNASQTVTDLFISGDTLAVLYNYYYSDRNRPYEQFYENTNSTRVALFDVSQISDPQPLHVLGQDGRLVSSRVYDGVLYLISEYSIGSVNGAKESDPRTYVPLLYDGVGDEDVVYERVLEPDEICILPDYDSASYTTVSSIDLSSGTRIESLSVLGQTSTVFMSTNNLFVVSSNYKNDEIITPLEGFKEQVVVSNYDISHISRFALNQGQLALEASAAVNGNLLNQFSLDEYQGYLRVALTRNDQAYSYERNVITGQTEDVEPDGAGKQTSPSGAPGTSGTSGAPGTSGSSSPSSTPGSVVSSSDQTNALVVLDGNLDVVGSVEGLAADERIYSVRFDGPLGYMVTFRQVDPLFTIDLSDPTNPQVLNALKIPGFSRYLHLYSPSRLLGLGMTADPNSGRTGGDKLSMFDTSNPFDVKEIAQLELNTDQSAALDNHKAVLISSEHDLIGFVDAKNNYQGNSGYTGFWDLNYLIYGYSDTRGFYKRAAIELPKDSRYYDGNTRGLYIGDYLYIVRGNHLGVLELETLELLTWIELSDSEQEQEQDPATPRPLYMIE